MKSFYESIVFRLFKISFSVMDSNNTPKKKEKKESASQMLYNVLKEILDTQSLILDKLENINATKKESVEDRAKAWRGL